ncbi:MAG TPA: hypothetical protein DEB70_00435 [Planctomycetaceae bacterium]|nr:hypothetical protein [Planctomycetaceae bacterium]
MRFNQRLQFGMLLFGLTFFGCSSNRVSVTIPVEKIQERMEIATTLEETNDQYFVSKALFDDLEAAADKISDNPTDVEEFKSLLEELKKCKPEDEEQIKSITGKMAGCLEIPEKFQPPFVRENKK